MNEMGNDQEVEFHEIEIHFYYSKIIFDHEIEFFLTFHEIEIPNNEHFAKTIRRLNRP